MVNNYSKAVYLATPYAFAISLAYLFGYWSTFDINILEYVSFADVIKLSLYPLVASLLFSVFGMIYGSLKPGSVKEAKRESGKNTRACILLLILLGIILIALDRYNLWFIGAYVFFLLLINLIYKEDVSIDELFPNYPQKVKSTIINILISLPLLAYASGKIDGKHIIIGYKTRFVNASILKENKLLTAKEKLKFLGLAGDYIFFLSEDNARCFIIRAEEIPVLELSEPSYMELSLIPKWRKNKK